VRVVYWTGIRCSAANFRMREMDDAGSCSRCRLVAYTSSWREMRLLQRRAPRTGCRPHRYSTCLILRPRSFFV
jgi:hypothetical protein